MEICLGKSLGICRLPRWISNAGYIIIVQNNVLIYSCFLFYQHVWPIPQNMMYSVEFTDVYWASIHGRFILMAYQVLSCCSSSPLATQFDKICKLKLKDHISGGGVVSISFTRHATILDKVQLIKNRHCFKILDSQFPWNN